MRRCSQYKYINKIYAQYTFRKILIIIVDTNSINKFNTFDQLVVKLGLNVTLYFFDVVSEGPMPGVGEVLVAPFLFFSQLDTI